MNRLFLSNYFTSNPIQRLFLQISLRSNLCRVDYSSFKIHNLLINKEIYRRIVLFASSMQLKSQKKCYNFKFYFKKILYTCSIN